METCILLKQPHVWAAPVLILPMRNGNFFPYLLSTHIPFHVLILPMRNGNVMKDRNLTIGAKAFLSYLWGMETILYSSFLLSSFFVLILPMRNGNSWAIATTATSSSCSYPTYEEWKHLTNSGVILPHYSLFLSYLWGMETKHYPISLSFAWSSRFLSYLWGMETQNFPIYSRFYKACSYPTYEEWKLYAFGATTFCGSCSYPTYEEWKPIYNRESCTTYASSYPTYEEWKQSNE